MADEREVPALSEPVYRILVALSEGPRHGYSILQALEADGFVIGTGTLYSALKRLRREGVVVETAAPDGSTDDPRRRHYRLSPLGEEWLAAEGRRLLALVRLTAPSRSQVRST